MAESGKNNTPLLDELEKGPWPSFVTEIKSMAGENKMSADLLGQLEKSYREKRGYWKHGGIVGVMGYGGGVIGRYSFLAEEFGGDDPLVTLVLAGKSPAQIPVATNCNASVYLNMALARRLGVHFPLDLVEQATLVSED